MLTVFLAKKNTGRAVQTDPKVPVPVLGKRLLQATHKHGQSGILSRPSQCILKTEAKNIISQRIKKMSSVIDASLPISPTLLVAVC